MSEIKLVKRVKYAGDVHTALMKLGWDAETAAAFLDSIPDAPTAEAEPVRHGRWLDNEDYMFCSVCGMQWYYCDNETQDFKFCPNCGAKMDALTFEEASRKLGQQAAETLKKLKEAGYDPKR